MVGYPFVPAAEGFPGGVLEDGLLVIVAGETADRVKVREPGDRSERDLPALIPAQELGAAESGNRP